MFGLFKKKKKNVKYRDNDELDAYVQYSDFTDVFKVAEEMKDDIGVTPALKEKLKGKLKNEEGYEYRPYHCSEGNLTIGVGRNLESKGLNVAEIDFMFENDIADVFLDLDRELPHWKYEPFNIRLVLCDLCFNLGIKGLTKFKNFLAAVEDADYEEAALELKKSKYFTQVPNRAKRNIKLVLSVI